MLGQLTTNGEAKFRESAKKAEELVNKIPAVLSDKDVQPITDAINDMLPSAATYLSGKRRNYILFAIIITKQSWAAEVAKKAAGTEIRREILQKINLILQALATPEMTIPAVPKDYTAQIADIVQKADKVKAAEVKKGLTPAEAKKRNKTLIFGGLAVGIAGIVAMFLRNKKGRK